MDAVVGHGKNTLDPLHDPGKIGALVGFDDEVDMISHDREIFDGEAVPSLRLGYDAKEEDFRPSAFQGHLLSVGTRGYVVPCVSL